MTRQGNNRVCRVSYMHEGIQIPFKLQFPLMSSPFQISKPEFQGVVKNFYQFSVSFYGENERPDLVAFREFIESINQRLIQILHENSAEWFHVGDPKAIKKPKAYETIQDNYQSLIRNGWSQTKNKQYADSVQLKCPLRNSTLQTVFFSSEKRPRTLVDFSEIDTQQAEVLVIAEIRELWIVAKYHPKFVATQVQIFPQDSRDEEYGFVGGDDESDESDESDEPFQQAT